MYEIRVSGRFGIGLLGGRQFLSVTYVLSLLAIAATLGEGQAIETELIPTNIQGKSKVTCWSAVKIISFSIHEAIAFR